MELERRKWPFIKAKRSTFENVVTACSFPTLKLVINAAAFVCKPSVDLNEQQKAETMLGNLVWPTILSAACQMHDVPLIHISTGCLYQGSNNGKGWAETDAPQLTMDAGAGTYVASKELAERVVSRYPNAYICRVRLPFDGQDHPRNLLTKFQAFDTVVDETQSIAHRGDFVNACLDLFEKRCPYGIYNVVNEGAVDYRWLCEQINLSLFNGKKQFKFVKPEQFEAKTVKSRCVLSVAKLKVAGVKMRPANEAVLASLDHWRK